MAILETNFRTSNRPTATGNWLPHCPWAKPYLPGGGGYEDFRQWNEIIRDINPYLFLVLPPVGIYKTKSGHDVQPILVWEHVNVGVAVQLFVWCDSRTGEPKPLDERLIENVIRPTDRERMTPELKKQLDDKVAAMGREHRQSIIRDAQDQVDEAMHDILHSKNTVSWGTQVVIPKKVEVVAP